MPVPASPDDVSTSDGYVLPNHRGDPTAPRFTLRCLRHVQRAKLEDLSGYDQATAEIRPNTGTRTLETVRAGLVGWEGVTRAGAPVPCELTRELVTVLGHRQNVVRENVLQVLPWEWLEELAREILRLSTLTVDEGKG